MATDFDNRVICEVQLVNIKLRNSGTKKFKFQAKKFNFDKTDMKGVTQAVAHGMFK